MAASCLLNSKCDASRVKHGGKNLTMVLGSHELNFKCTYQFEILAKELFSSCIFVPNGNNIMKSLATHSVFKMGLISFCLASTNNCTWRVYAIAEGVYFVLAMVLSGEMEETEETWILYLAFFIHSRKNSILFGTPYLLKCSFALLPSFSSATPKQAKHNFSHLTPPS